MAAGQPTAARSQDRADSGAVGRAVDQLREMVASMELLPGHAVRQEALAERLGVSRAPVREALRILASEGLLEHTRNVGYAVKRLTASEFEQTYLMRRALETEVLRALPALTSRQLEELDRVNRAIEEAVGGSGSGETDPAGAVATIRRLNIDFHFALFRASGLDLVVDELRRIWALSDAYRSAYLVEPAARRRIVAEHDEMIAALRAGDHDRVVALMDEHRHGTRNQITALLAQPGFRAP